MTRSSRCHTSFVQNEVHTFVESKVVFTLYISWRQSEPTDRNVELSTTGSPQNQHYSKEINTWCYNTAKPHLINLFFLSKFWFISRHRNSATIKATSTELSYLLLLGIAMNYCCTFLFIATPTDIICSAKILVMGASFSVYVGALLTKTNRISRIFNRKLSDGAPSMFLNIQVGW